MIDMNTIVGTRDLALIVLDTLRFDVADQELREGRTPNLARLIPNGWEKRHSPGTFTYASHCSNFPSLPAPMAEDRKRLA